MNIQEKNKLIKQNELDLDTLEKLIKLFLLNTSFDQRKKLKIKNELNTLFQSTNYNKITATSKKLKEIINSLLIIKPSANYYDKNNQKSIEMFFQKLVKNNEKINNIVKDYNYFINEIINNPIKLLTNIINEYHNILLDNFNIKNCETTINNNNNQSLIEELKELEKTYKKEDIPPIKKEEYKPSNDLIQAVENIKDGIDSTYSEELIMQKCVLEGTYEPDQIIDLMLQISKYKTFFIFKAKKGNIKTEIIVKFIYNILEVLPTKISRINPETQPFTNYLLNSISVNDIFKTYENMIKIYNNQNEKENKKNDEEYFRKNDESNYFKELFKTTKFTIPTKEEIINKVNEIIIEELKIKDYEKMDEEKAFELLTRSTKYMNNKQIATLYHKIIDYYTENKSNNINNAKDSNNLITIKDDINKFKIKIKTLFVELLNKKNDLENKDFLIESVLNIQKEITENNIIEEAENAFKQLGKEERKKFNYARFTRLIHEYKETDKKNKQQEIATNIHRLFK